MSFSNTSTGDKPADPYKTANVENVDLKTKVGDLVEFMKSCKFGMMTTREPSTGNLASRCMALAATESGGVDLLFHTNNESGKTDDLSNDPNINISFLNSSGEWASISGEASIVTDRTLIKENYNATLKAWLGDLGDGKHDGSAEDPRLGIIRVTAKTAVYSLAAKGIFGRVGQVAEGALTGKPAQINSLREITVDDMRLWRATMAA